MTAAVSLTQTHTIIMAHWQAHRQAHFSINVRRPGVESIAWSHFSSICAPAPYETMENDLG